MNVKIYSLLLGERMKNKYAAANIIRQWYFYADEDKIIEEKKLDDYNSLIDFCEDILINYNAPLIIIPSAIRTNQKFLAKVLKRKPNLINELYDVEYFAFLEYIKSVDLHKFLLKCKFKLNPAAKQEIKNQLALTTNNG